MDRHIWSIIYWNRDNLSVKQVFEEILRHVWRQATDVFTYEVHHTIMNRTADARFSLVAQVRQNVSQTIAQACATNPQTGQPHAELTKIIHDQVNWNGSMTPILQPVRITRQVRRPGTVPKRLPRISEIA